MVPWEILASLVGGLIAVAVGQYLAYYRNVRQQKEEFTNTVRALSNLDSETLARGILSDGSYVDHLIDSLFTTYRQNITSFDEMQRSNVEEILITVEERKQDYDSVKYANLGPSTRRVLQRSVEEVIDSANEILDTL